MAVPFRGGHFFCTVDQKSKQLPAAWPGRRYFRPWLSQWCSVRAEFTLALPGTCALANSNDLGARALLALSSGDANGVFYLKHLTRMVPGATDAALSPDIASLNNPGPGLPNYTTPVFHQ